jgi:hypothetical protein
MSVAKKSGVPLAKKMRATKRAIKKPRVVVPLSMKVAAEFVIVSNLEAVEKHYVPNASGGKYVVFTSPVKPRHLSTERIAEAIAELS